MLIIITLLYVNVDGDGGAAQRCAPPWITANMDMNAKTMIVLQHN